MKDIKQFITSLEKEIKNIDDEMERELELGRLQEALRNYDGEDRLVSSYEVAERLKTAPDEKKMLSGVLGLDEILKGFRLKQLIVLTAATKSGKCLGRGTEVLMSDGSLKKVEDIRVGNKVMGADSKPRNVLALGQGREEMFEISQRGGVYVVNKSHILSLMETGMANQSKYKGKVTSRRYRKGKVVNISVEDYLEQSKTFKHCHKGYRTGVEFKKRALAIDPYFLGLWLGDGNTSSASITSADEEISDYLSGYAKLLELTLVKIKEKSKAFKLSITRGNKFGGSQAFSLQKLLSKCGVLNSKHIPKEYKINSRENRLKLLAGLLDSDGHHTKNKYPYFDYITKLKVLADDVNFLASSLGFQVSVKKCKKGIKSSGFVGEYYRLSISGNIWEIPTKIKRKIAVDNGLKHKNVLTSKIKVSPLGVGEYYGFELDGDGLFVLGNFVVTHNTSFAIELTSNLKDEHPMWLPFEEGAEELVQKFLDRNEAPPLFYTPDRMSGNTLLWVEKKIIEAKAKYGTNIIFIDHLHFIVDFGENMSLQIGRTMRELKRIAKDWNVAIVLIAHLKKTKMDVTPTLEDIRDSSFIAQEADTVIMLWRETKMVNGDIEITNNVNVSVQANRRTGKTGNVKMIFSNGRFLQEDWKHKDDTFDNW